MSDEHKYSLTRICLRSGQMSLSRSMTGLFPDEGDVVAVDTAAEKNYTLSMLNPRTVGGLMSFYEANDLEVNDEVVISPLEDGRFALTPVKRSKKTDFSRPDIIKGLLDEIIGLTAPFSDTELRGLLPDIPPTVDLSEILEADGRFAKHAGRWYSPELQKRESERYETEKRERDRHEATKRESAREVQREREPLEANAPFETLDEDSDTFDAFIGREEVAPPPLPEADPFEEPRARPPRRPMVTPYPRNVMFPGDVGLNSAQEAPQDLTLHTRAREALQRFGFRIEVLSPGQILAHADLGRHHYNALIHLHPERTRLDWAGLLARRREVGASYLAVFGEHRDLLRLHSPADLARATLWSWEALEQVQDIATTVPISPFDLEPHFQRDGLFEQGMERFEKAVSKRIVERGNFSAVISRLANMKAPSIFLLEDVLVDVDLSRDQVLKVLELLGQAPFHMVTKVDSGEFCLRYEVRQGLQHLSEYALSLRERLPSSRNTERLAGSDEGSAPQAEAEAEDEGQAVDKTLHG